MAIRKFLYMDQTEGFATEQAASDELSIGKITLAGVSGVAIDAGAALISNVGDAVANGQALVFGQASATLGNGLTIGGTTVSSGQSISMSGGGTVTGLPTTPAGATDAASKSYVDAVAQGLSVKGPVDVVATANQAVVTGLAQTIDGYALSSDGLKVLLTAQTSGIDNGIWIVHSGAWTREPDLAVGSHAMGAFTFVQDGTTWANTGWVCTNDGPTDVVGTDALAFVQFSGAGTYTAGSGLQLVGNQFSVNLNTNPGLQFTSSKLEVKPDGTRGIAKDASGIYAKIDGSSITFDISGNIQASASLSAVSAFKVMNPLTTGAVGVSAGDPVYVSANNTVLKGDTSVDAQARVIGVAMAAAASTSPVSVISAGPALGVLTGATAGAPYYLATGGGLSTTIPGSGKRVMQVGVALNATDLFVRIVDYGKKA